MTVHLNNDSIPPYKLLDGVPITDGLATQATIVKSMQTVAYQVYWSGNTGTGTWKLQGAISTDNGTTVTWSDIDADPFPLTGTTGSFLIDIASTSVERTRLVYTQITPSSGVVTAIVTAKRGG